MASAKDSAIAKKKCVTPIFRLSYPALFKPKSFEGQEAKYGCTMLFPKKTWKEQGKKLRIAAQNALKEKWGDDKAKWPKKIRMPFRDGSEEREDAEGYKGQIFVGTTSKHKPGVVDESVQEITAEGDIYAGCYCRAEVIAFVYDMPGNKGVSFALQNIQKMKDGKPFSGRKKPEEVFDAVEDDGDEDEDSEDGDEDEDDDGDEFK